MRARGAPAAGGEGQGGMTAAQALAASITERDFQAQVVQFARLCGWRCYHTHDSRRSEPGFPDLILARPPRLLAVELKTNRGKVTDAQAEWLETLAACGVTTAVVRP